MERLDRNGHPLSGGAAMKKRGASALREIKREQNLTSPVFEHRPFRRLCRELASDISTEVTQLEEQAYAALQEACELHILHLFSDANLVCVKMKMKTLMPDHIRTARRVSFGGVDTARAWQKGHGDVCDDAYFERSWAAGNAAREAREQAAQ